LYRDLWTVLAFRIPDRFADFEPKRQDAGGQMPAGWRLSLD
jgi:hypothetical protein